MMRRRVTTFEDFLRNNPLLTTDFKSIVSEYYSTDVFTCEQARTTWVKPDKKLFSIVD